VPAVSPLRTLIVDESETFLLGAALWMEDRPELIVVGSARTGPEAVAAVDRLLPDLVILDAVLPELDGFRVTRLIKTRPQAPLVVIATFLTSSAAREEALAAGADGFLAKDDFAEGLEGLLGELTGSADLPSKQVTSPQKPVRPGSRSARDL